MWDSPTVTLPILHPIISPLLPPPFGRSMKMSQSISWYRPRPWFSNLLRNLLMCLVLSIGTNADWCCLPPTWLTGQEFTGRTAARVHGLLFDHLILDGNLACLLQSYEQECTDKWVQDVPASPKHLLSFMEWSCGKGRPPESFGRWKAKEESPSPAVYERQRTLFECSFWMELTHYWYLRGCTSSAYRDIGERFKRVVFSWTHFY